MKFYLGDVKMVLKNVANMNRFNSGYSLFDQKVAMTGVSDEYLGLIP